MKLKKQQPFVFYTIKGSTIKKFLILDCITGTGLYYALKIYSSSVVIGILGSMVGVEGVRKISVRKAKRIK